MMPPLIRRELSRRERRGLALLVLALLIAALYWLLIGSWFSGPLETMAQQREDLRLQQQHYAGLLARREAITRQVQAQGNNPALTRSLQPGDDPGIAAAALMSRLTQAIESHGAQGAGCEISQRMPIVTDTHPEQPYAEVAVSLMLHCRIEPLMAALHDIEYQPPWLVVSTLSIHRPEEAPANGAAGKLEIQLLVKGWLQRHVSPEESE